MPAKKPPITPAGPLVPRAEWCAEFSLEVERLRKLSPGKFVEALAQQEWAAHHNEDPVKVAQAWAKRTAVPKR